MRVSIFKNIYGTAKNSIKFFDTLIFYFALVYQLTVDILKSLHLRLREKSKIFKAYFDRILLVRANKLMFHP